MCVCVCVRVCVRACVCERERDLLSGEFHLALVLKEQFQHWLHHPRYVDLQLVTHPCHYLLDEEDYGVLEVVVLRGPEFLQQGGGRV